jgi:formylglycine-generating enzyme required for sulfatase activity
MMSRTIRCVVAAAVLSLCSTMGASAQSCNADLNDDGLIDGKDLAIVLSAWGACPTVISSVTPIEGSVLGGTEITINGSGLSAVTVGGAPCTNVTVVSPRQIRATTPPGQVGSAEIVVTAAGGSETAAEEFTYFTASVPMWATLIEEVPDPAVVHDASLRASIIAAGYAWRVRDTATQIELVLIPPGTFQMGCSPSNQYGCQLQENPIHTVTLTNAFYLGRYEVTQQQWIERMGSSTNNSVFGSPSAEVLAGQVRLRPVENVSAFMISVFLNENGMRLPTEAEWEYAYRAGTTTAFHSMPVFPSGTNDDNQLGAIAWFGSNSASQTRPVGQLAGNGFGLHDMSGNVREKVKDYYSATYYVSSPSVNPTGPSSGSFRVVRGGSWYHGSNECRSAYRDGDYSTNGATGFRVARDP